MRGGGTYYSTAHECELTLIVFESNVARPPPGPCSSRVRDVRIWTCFATPVDQVLVDRFFCFIVKVNPATLLSLSRPRMRADDMLPVIHGLFRVVSI